MKKIRVFCMVVLLLCGCGRQAGIVNEKTESEQGADMSVYDFSEFGNVDITGCDLNNLSEIEQALLYAQARWYTLST